MKISQLTKVIDRQDRIIIDDKNKRITEMCIFDGIVKDIKRDDPINKMHVECIYADDSILYVLATRSERELQAKK